MIFFLLLVSAAFALNFDAALIIESPSTVLNGVPFDVHIKLASQLQDSTTWPLSVNYSVFVHDTIVTRGEIKPYSEPQVNFKLKASHNGKYAFRVAIEQGSKVLVSEVSDTFVIPAGLSIIPSLLTIIIAVWLKQNILALFAGVWLGAMFTCHYNPFNGLLKTIDTVIINSLSDSDHSKVIYFCLLIGGMIAIVAKGGGAVGLALSVTKYAKTRKSGQLVTFFIGVLTFFDDYASCLIAGSTMRDITGRLLISREKFSFIVDTVAVTMCSLFIVSSWVGVEISNIQEQLKLIDDTDPYMTFLESIPYKFYPFAVLIFCLMLILSGRDFGPMLDAERRAFQHEKISSDHAKPVLEDDDEMLTPIEGKPLRMINSLLPFLTMIIVVFLSLILEGYFKVKSMHQILDQKILMANSNGFIDLANYYVAEKDKWPSDITKYFSVSNPFHSLIYGSFSATVIALVLLVMIQKILTLSQAMEAWFNGCKSMVFAILLLAHAWSLGHICNELHTSDFIVTALVNFPAGFLPAIVFLLGAATSFATGSAWGTMSILFPLVIPLAKGLCQGDSLVLLYASSAAVLSGSVWGNHVSPIADSCIMSSMSSGCDHNDHVKTQAVYALTVGAITVICCSIPVGFNCNVWVAHLISIIVMGLVIYLFGGKAQDNEPSIAVSFWFKYVTRRPLPNIVIRSESQELSAVSIQ